MLLAVPAIPMSLLYIARLVIAADDENTVAQVTPDIKVTYEIFHIRKSQLVSEIENCGHTLKHE